MYEKTTTIQYKWDKEEEDWVEESKVVNIREDAEAAAIGTGQPLDILDLGSREGDYEFEGVLFAWAEGDVLGGEMATVLERGGGLILTDDFAPVDNLLAPIYTGQ